ncbi:PREDICTED: proto-oncogene DBL [Elephantulus edwardii]|uniref:proto-oncogene DBL n=1 Tax=Elephantulus edwardii TaxID=28737 RepID=UPI0003F0E4CA|nr:PREDICTED: proto-oncogene DBL [Elephantulus edwardii]
MQNIAFLSGGRGKDNAWIITFPENCNFRCIPEDIIAKVLTFLTSIAKKNGSDSRFTIILDRRSDTWSSLKASLQRISASFPGNLHLVLVLRPTSFLQRTFTDVGFRFSHEDFMLKLPVVMLSSVSDLLTYIDAKQLTPELGGTLQYCHSEWIIFRNAIENFAISVKEMAQMLQSFGTELAETELPENFPEIEEIFEVHSERYNLLKSNITTITKEGTVLLTNLEAPETSEAVSRSIEPHPKICGDWQTVNKLLSQVHDMETAFDGFWEKHQQKMDQHLELWKFEQEFKDLMAKMKWSLKKLSELTDATGNIIQVKHKLKKLDIVDESSQNLLKKARFMVLHGHKLAASHHYAVDLICQRCNELRYLTDILANEIKTKRIQLSRTFKLHKLLQQAWQCCDEGEYLLINQQDDKFQSKEDAQKTLQDIENFLQVALPFINYDIETLQYEFDVVLSPELKNQMQTVQLKLETIRTVFENQQAVLRSVKEKHANPFQLVVAGTEQLMRTFSPRYALGIGHSFFQACKLFLKGKKTWQSNLSNVKIEVIHDFPEEQSSSQSSVLTKENTLAILKNHVLNELIQTEKIYVRELFTVLLGYRAQMDNPEMMDIIPPLLRSKKDVLFGNMPEIYEFHNNIFMHRLENCFHYPELVGQCFLERKNDFQLYAKYCQNKPLSETIWKKYSDCTFFKECQKKLKHRLGLDSYLLKPVQRITKYQLLLKELLKYSGGCRGTEQLKQALDTILELLKSVNDSMHQIAITGFVGDLSDLGKMILQGPFSVWTCHRKGTTKMTDFGRFKSTQRHIFLYEKAIVFCKSYTESGDSSDRYPSYKFKHCLKLDNIGLTEYVKGSNRKFEIWCNAKEEIYTVQAPTLNVKTSWLREIRNILLKNHEFMTVKKQEQLPQPPNWDPFSFQKSDKKQQRRFLSSGCEYTGALAGVCEAAMPVKVEEDTVWTEISLSSETSEEPKEGSRELLFSSLAEHEVEDRPGMACERNSENKEAASIRKKISLGSKLGTIGRKHSVFKKLYHNIRGHKFH